MQSTVMYFLLLSNLSHIDFPTKKLRVHYTILVTIAVPVKFLRSVFSNMGFTLSAQNQQWSCSVKCATSFENGDKQ